MTGDGSLRPRLRSGWALKQIEGDAEERWILRDLRNDTFRTIEAEDAALLQMLDGRRTVAELLDAGHGGRRPSRARAGWRG